MANDIIRVFQANLQIMLRPVVRFCLKRSIPIQHVVEALKKEFVENALHELRATGQTTNISRIIVATGMHRQEVLRIWKGDEKESLSGHVMAVIGQWSNDKRYTNKSGTPRILSIEGDNSEFHGLVRDLFRDVHPRSVLESLERIGAVERVPHGLKLIQSVYDPAENPAEAYEFYAEDASHMLETVSENIALPKGKRNLHVRTEFDNINVEDLQRIREWIFKEGNSLHEKAEKMLAKSDLDVNPKRGAVGKAKVVFCSFARLIKE